MEIGTLIRCAAEKRISALEMLYQISGIAFLDMRAEREHEGLFALGDEIVYHGRPYCEKVSHLGCIVG